LRSPDKEPRLLTKTFPLPRWLQLAAMLALLAFPAMAQDVPSGHLPIATSATANDKQEGDKTKDAKPGGEADAEQVASKLPSPAITHHTVTVEGQVLRYTAEAGTISLPGSDGKVAADIFHVAYTRDPLDTKRPVTFVFNGGPGAASAYLHLGAIGPRMIETDNNGKVKGPPPRLVDNPSTWLDMTDLVFVDPVGTGYSRTRDGKDEKYWGVDKDTDALADFVRLYLTKSARMLSPVFLMGESYGGFRAASLSRALQKTGANSPSGLVLISPVLEFGLLYTEDYDPLTWALELPSLAAVNLESKGTTGRAALRDALKEAERYAMSDYLVDIASGVDAGGKAASETVSRLTGLPLETVERHHARIDSNLYVKEFDRAEGQVLSRYDGSVGAPDPNPASSWPNGPDPVLDATVPLWTAAFVDYAANELGYKTDATYQLLNRTTRSKWDFGTSATHQGYAGVIDKLQEARSANPELRVLIASGYTDLITPYLASTYLVGQLPVLPRAEPIQIENYVGGHMLYLRPDSRAALKRDAKGMYEQAAKAAAWPRGEEPG
jgi:carboxypeptidase C (cathepsin A)